ncbi:MAG TPA: class I SAM-dependent methyltransferase [Candidatus Aquilonibacter sp.]|nr:class I SAM-dependent methyltransferase [Candidatus Aquilonibacter sp.]
MSQCKICGHATAAFGEVDFSKNCEELAEPATGERVRYERCSVCGFVFTRHFDSWNHERFAERVYNADYGRFDLDYEETRPRNMARLLVNTFGDSLRERSLLDYGSGSGRFVEEVRPFVAHAAGFDPFTASDASLLDRRYDIVTCFEVLEHETDPMRAIRRLALAASNGIVVHSTLVQNAEFDARGIEWWYIAPRNGHVSIFSRAALATAWQRVGFQVASMNDDLHVAFASIPPFARRLFSTAP